MLNFVLVVYIASSVASFQTVGPFSTKIDCDGVKTQLAENFPDIKSACLAMTTASLRSIVEAKMPTAPPKAPPKVIVADSVASKPKVKSVAVPLPKPRPIVCPFKE